MTKRNFLGLALLAALVPVAFWGVTKPRPLTLADLPQHTIDLANGENTPTRYERSDFCPVPRAVPILEAMIAFVLADALLEKLGGDSLDEMRPRFAALRQARPADLPMDGTAHIFWPDDAAGLEP